MKVIGTLKVKVKPHLLPGLSQKDEIEEKKGKVSNWVQCH